MARCLLRLVCILGVVGVLASVWPFGLPRALACSCDAAPLSERVRRADFVVVGVVTEWKTLDDPHRQDAFTPIELTLTVEQALKGDAPAVLTFIDDKTYDATSDAWVGRVGSCGTFDADPTGHRAAYFLSEADDSTLRAGRCSGTYIGIGLDEAFAGSTSEEYIAEVAAAASALALPDTGSGSPAHPSAGTEIGAAAIALLGASALAFTMAVLARRA